MTKCKFCGRKKGWPEHVEGICDTVVLTDGRIVHASRVMQGGDLAHAQVQQRNITQEMRNSKRAK